MPIFPSGYPEKTSNSDEDRFLISDSTDSNKIKGTKWSTIKSSIEGFTDWITTSMLKNDSVIPNKLQSGTGSSWEWQDWVPTVEGYTGTPSIECRYIQIGKTVHVKGFINGTSNHNQKYISLPVPANTTIDPVFLGLAYTNGANGDRIGAIMLRPGDGKIQFYCGFSQGAGSSLFTGWATSGDAGFRFTATYDAA